MTILCVSGNSSNSNTYSEHQQRTFSPPYSQQQPPHYTPHSPASPVASGSYTFSNRHSSPSAGPVSATPHHGMNYNNPQQQALYSSALSPGHYGSPNHGEFSVTCQVYTILLISTELLIGPGFEPRFPN